MSANDQLGLSSKIVPLEESRALSAVRRTASKSSFEETLAAAEMPVACEVVPLPINPERSAWPSPEPLECDIEIFFEHIEDRMKSLEYDLLSLTRQVSALLRCL